MHSLQFKSLVILIIAATQAIVTSASSCISKTNNHTFALFSNAPITYSRQIHTVAACEKWCGEVKNCQAWLYLAYASQCDLHRAAALATSSNELFVYGGCEPTRKSLKSAATALPASVASPSVMISPSGVPSSSTAIRPTPSASTVHKHTVGQSGSSSHGHSYRHGSFTIGKERK